MEQGGTGGSGSKALAVALLLELTASGCTTARLQGFDALASRPDLEALPISGLPWSGEGDFRLGATTGHAAWRSAAAAQGWGPDGDVPAEQVRVGQVARLGLIAFSLGAEATPGYLEGRCRYGRTEERTHIFGLDIATAGRPLRLQCAYRLDGRDAGTLTLVAQPPADGIAEPRIGMIRFDGHDLQLRSDHAIEGAGPSASPMGYRLTTADGRLVGLVETNGWRDRRLLLTREAAERPAAIAAALSLALFRDPGDTD